MKMLCTKVTRNYFSLLYKKQNMSRLWSRDRNLITCRKCTLKSYKKSANQNVRVAALHCTISLQRQSMKWIILENNFSIFQTPPPPKMLILAFETNDALSQKVHNFANLIVPFLWYIIVHNLPGNCDNSVTL